MRFLPFGVALLLILGGSCSQSSSGGDSGNPGDGGNGDAGGNAAFAYYDLTGPTSMLLPGTFAIAVGPNDHVGVAYFQLSDGGYDAAILLPDGGTDNTQGLFLHNFDVEYLEWAGGTIVTPPQQVTTAPVQITVGISLAFQANGEPAVAYVGGPNKNQNPYWFQQNATVNFRSNGSTWTETVVDTFSTDDPPPATDLPNSVDTAATAQIMGLYPSLVIDGGTAWLAYRDVHGGQFPKQDWGGSDLKVAVGTANGTNWNLGGAAWGGNNKDAWGGHNQLVIGLNGWPAVISDQLPGGSNGEGANVVFFQDNNYQLKPWLPDYEISPGIAGQIVQNSTSGWGTGYLGDTGPTMDFDPGPQGLGYGVAFNCRGCLNGVDQPGYTQCTPPMDCTNGNKWTSPDYFFASGTGGWWPSLAFDPGPTNPHTASIAVYNCALHNSITHDACPIPEDEVIVWQQVGSNWTHLQVDPDGYFEPKLKFLSSEQRVVVYQMRDGHIRLAVEH
jgi:hypothetical protein